MMQPTIGIISDYETSSTYSNYPWYALRENYITSVLSAGGVPIIIPHELNALNHYFNLIDGLVISGGNFDVDPSYYGEAIDNDRVILKDKRTQFEFEFAMKAYNNNLPILGICGGEQLINVILGGSLIQHIPDYVKNALEHEQKTPKHLASHSITIDTKSLLYKIIGSNQIEVNSTHHQAVKTLGNNLIASAYASDGVIEAIESNNRKFCVGVQWHPEYYTTEYDKNLFRAFINAC